MDILNYLIPFLIAACAGLLYGISFLMQHRTLIMGYSTQINRAQGVAFFLARILILWIVASYLLRKPALLFILASIVFFGIFWLTLLLAKARSHERV